MGNRKFCTKLYNFFNCRPLSADIVNFVLSDSAFVAAKIWYYEDKYIQNLIREKKFHWKIRICVDIILQPLHPFYKCFYPLDLFTRNGRFVDSIFHKNRKRHFSKIQRGTEPGQRVWDGGGKFFAALAATYAKSRVAILARAEPDQPLCGPVYAQRGCTRTGVAPARALESSCARHSTKSSLKLAQTALR